MKIILHDALVNKRAFRVRATGPVSEETAIERAGLALSHLCDTPMVGITMEDVLTLPKEMQNVMGFEAEETEDENEPGYWESHYRNEYLVKPQVAREDEIAAYIVGYMEAQYKKGAPGVQGKPDYCISHMEAKDWAEIFLMRKHVDKYMALPAFIEEMIEERIQSEW
ncbi:hypothetical protein AALA61_12960 [Oscillospiraceae bacterium 42-9]